MRVNNKQLKIDKPITLYDLSNLYKDDFKYQIIGAVKNGKRVDMSTTVNNKDVVSFFDRTSRYGNRIYERSLCFICSVALKELFASNLIINYSLENGIYCEVNQKITKTDILKLEEKMKEIINEKHEFTKHLVDKEEALNYFKETDQLDKINNLIYNNNETIKLYKLKGYYDFYFEPLALNTNQIRLFKLFYLKENSFLLNFPTIKNPTSVKDYNHKQKIFDKYREYLNWSRKINLSSVYDLNNLITDGNYKESIMVSEAYYNNQLFELSSKIEKSDKKLILIAGPSSSGKTTTASKLALYLKAKGINAYKISLDDYFVNRSQTPKDEEGKYDFSSLKATNVALFNNHLKKLLNKEEVLLPTYDFKKGRAFYKNKYLKLNEKDILIVEGIHALNDKLTKFVSRDKKMKVFISPLTQLKIDDHNRISTSDVRKLRRLVRDNQFRGYSADDTLSIWPNVDKEAFEKIYPYQYDSDYIVNTALNYEVSVLKIFAEPLLYKIKETSDNYPEAQRLINLLRNFLVISSEYVPSTSILREFIGNSDFREE